MKRPWLLLLVAGCAATWKAGPELYAPVDHVAAALGEERAPQPLVFETPIFVAPPVAVRPCCAFGVDLSFAAVPLYRIGNVMEPAQLGRHFYGAGALEAERNGLIYTCRGGWIDTAHARENADLTFFLISQLVQQLPGPVTIELTGEGGQRTVEVKQLPQELMDRWGRERLAEALASWVAWRFATWHELSSWFGFEALPGYPERVSSFSPEDMYSNALGIRLGAAVAREGGLLSRANYDALSEAWLHSMVDFLVPADTKSGREAMRQLDGRWWDSTRKLPDPLLVKRRALATGNVVQPWRLEDAFEPGRAPLPPACEKRPRALQLTVPERVGELVIADYVDVIWRPGPWANGRVPWPDPERHELHARDLPQLTARVQAELERTLGPGFDRPR
ncbi:MAG: DUF4056 domain-containing protein [Myxococcota bacterium]